MWTRTGVVGTGLIVATSVALCLVPGFNVLNYYASFALALLGGVLAGLVGASAARRALQLGRRPFSEALKASVPLVLLPPLILLLNALRVRNCDLGEGLLFYLAGAGFSMLIASQVGAFCAVVTRRHRWAVMLFVLIWLASIGRDVWHIIEHPAIFAYNPFVGFFSGAIYDTVINLDSRLLLFRASNLAQVSVLWLLANLWWDRDKATVTLAAVKGASRSQWLALALAVVVASGFYGARGAIGYEVSREHIQAELGGRLESDRLVLIYDQRVIGLEEASALLEDHHYRLEQLDAELGEVYPHQITSYVYSSNSQKRAMMGAGRVYVAKPWLKEIHLSRVPYGKPVVRHELAHVVLGRYVDNFFEVPTVLCVVPQAALVEGAAEAFEWDTGALTPHQWSAAMRRAKLAPDLSKLLRAESFYQQASGRAYTLSGSFIRWLIDTRGIERFKTAYADGDFEGAYERPWSELADGWAAFVDALAISDDQAALAAARFHKKAIFFRPCPLEIARLEDLAGKLAAAGIDVAALSVYDEVVSYVPDDARKRLPRLALTARGGDVDGARAAHAAYFARQGRDPVTDAYATELLSDALWRGGAMDEAHAGYRSIWNTAMSEGRFRNVVVKLAISDDPDLEPVLGPYLLGSSAGDGADYLFEAAVDFPEHPLIIYLLGRRLSQLSRFEESAFVLERAIGLLQTSQQRPSWAAPVLLESWRLLGHALFKVGELERAESAFDKAAELTRYGGDRARYQDWAARCRWKRKL